MWREILGLDKKPNGLLDLITPRRSFSDVILPEETRKQLYEALTQIDKHRLIFNQWGLGERHPTGLGLVFNFAGPPGTGKTICAEAIAFTLGRKLLRVRYSELESCWAGETGKNIRTVFKDAKANDAVLFFDEADSIAARRFSNVVIGYEREANQAVNILLKEVEEHDGVVIFATNMASNFDPAFERRIRTHILFRLPGAAERERIWKVQVHPDKTPIAEDVDFAELADRFEVSGGDIRNAVLKAAQIAAAEEGSDEGKRIHQRHFLLALEQVRNARQVMRQNAIDPLNGDLPWKAALEGAEKQVKALRDDLHACRTELGQLTESEAALEERVSGYVTRLGGVEERVGSTAERVAALTTTQSGLAERADSLRDELEALREEAQEAARHATALVVWRGEQETSVRELAERFTAREEQLARATLIGWPRQTTVMAGTALGGVLLLLGALAGWLLPH